MSLGDMEAQAASLRLGERRFAELCDKYGLDVVLGAIDAALEHGERLTRLELAEAAGRRLQSGGHDRRRRHRNGPFPVRVEVTITAEERCDFTGTHASVPGPVNCTYTALDSGTERSSRPSTGAGDPRERGVLRPLPRSSARRDDLHRRAARARLDLLGDDELRHRPRVAGARARGAGPAPGGPFPLGLRRRRRGRAPGARRSLHPHRAAGRGLGRGRRRTASRASCASPTARPTSSRSR